MTGAKTTRIVSIQIGVLVLLGLWMLVQASRTPGGVLAFASGGFLMGIAVLVRTRGTAVSRTVASVLVPVIALVFLAGVIVSGQTLLSLVTQADTTVLELIQIAVRDFGLSFASGLAVLGAVGTTERGLGDWAVSRFAGSAIGTGIIVLIAVGAFVYLRSAIVTSVEIPTVHLEPVRQVVLTPPNPGSAMGVTLTLIFATAVIGRLTLSAVPVVELAPRRHEDTFEEAISSIRSWLAIVAILAVFIGTILLLIGNSGSGTGVSMVESMDQTIGSEMTQLVLTLLAGDMIRIGLLGATGVLLGLTLVFRSIELFTGSIAKNVRLLIPSIIGGMTAVALAFGLAPTIYPIIEQLPEGPQTLVIQATDMLSPIGLVLGIIAVAIIGLVGGLLAFSFAGGIRYIPQRGAGGTLAATGLGIGGITLGIVGNEPLAVIVMVGLSIVVWNVNQRGVRTRSELDTASPPTLETLHAIGSYIAVVPAVSLAWFLYTNTVPSIAVPDGTVAGVLVTLVVLIMLIVAING